MDPYKPISIVECYNGCERYSVDSWYHLDGMVGLCQVMTFTLHRSWAQMVSNWPTFPGTIPLCPGTVPSWVWLHWDRMMVRWIPRTVMGHKNGVGLKPLKWSLYLQMNLPDTLKSAFAAVLNTLLPGIPSSMGRIDLYVLTTVTFRYKKPIRSLWQLCARDISYWTKMNDSQLDLQETICGQVGASAEDAVSVLQPSWRLVLCEGSECRTLLGGGFKYFLCSPLFGEDDHFDEHIFQMGWFNHQPVLRGNPWHWKTPKKKRKERKGEADESTKQGWFHQAKCVFPLYPWHPIP